MRAPVTGGGSRETSLSFTVAATSAGLLFSGGIGRGFYTNRLGDSIRNPVVPCRRLIQDRAGRSAAGAQLNAIFGHRENMTFLLTRDGDPARRRRSWPVMACLLLALPFPGNTTAMDNEHTPAQQDVAPETTIGEGSQSRRPVIRDPVTGVAWADKPYHVTVYGHDGTGTVLDLAGTTDDQGRTAHLRVPEQTGRQDIMAVPVIGEGDYAIRARMTRPSGQPAAHHGYVLVLANGAVFMGKADETGHVAMVHTVEPTEVVLRMQYFPDSDAWQAQAEALNDTVRTHDYAKRLAIYRQQFAAAPWENHEDAGLLDAEALAGPLLTTAVHTTSEDFESAARRYVSIRALARARKNIQADPDIDAAASENPEDYIGSAARLSAHLDLLARMADLSGPAIPPAFITELGEETVALLDDLEPVDLRRTDHRIMTASQQLMHDGHEQTAAEVFRASGYLQRRGSSIDGDDLAFAALVADILGDDDRSRQLMSYANVASRLSYEL